ncbi:MAG: hypothetical protein R3301_11700 [Saprospiraceae bacterium]|nr:hypothetical protein [Saprospiraceae bacterium]
MKALVPVLLTCLLCLTMHAQPVSVTTDGLTLHADETALAAWQERHHPVLHGFPISEQLVLTSGVTAPLRFEKAERVVLVIDPGKTQARGTLICTRPDGTELQRLQITRNDRRLLLEVGTADFNLHFQQSGKAEKLHLTRIYVVPPVSQNAMRDFGFNTSLDCEPNASCPDGAPWSDQVRAAVRIMMVLQEGVGWCSGTLMNNTAGDGRPFILSAEHCLAEYTPMWDLWRFDFSYRSDACMTPGTEPVASSLTGCTLRAKQRDTDFLLLELNDPVPVFFNAYFSGWNRTPDYAPGKTVLIHHPSGDIAKMSTDFHQITLWENSLIWNEGYTTPENTHYRSRFDLGTFEPGSSGGAIFDTSRHVIAQLHGGIGDCNANTAYSGRVSVSWEYGDDASGRLADWLDPLGTGQMILDGSEHPDQGNVFHVTGVVRDPMGRPVRDVMVTLDGGVVLNVEADTNGVFAISELPRSSEITFSARKNNNPKNGVSAADLFLIKKHLLGDAPFTEPWQVLAADATGNATVSAGDILILQKLLLGLVAVLPTQDAWIFDPPSISVLEPADSEVQIEFTAIKVGDVNGTADPNQ